MAQPIFSQNDFSGGIQSYPKTPTYKNGFYFGRSVNFRDDPQAITLLPGAVKESGSVVTDLIKWGDLLPSTFDSYFYGDTGNLYHRDNAGSWSNMRTAAASHGNGLTYFFADDYLYYACDATLGRGGPVSVNPSSFSFSDDFLKAQGRVPQNTASLVLAATSSQYATAASSVSLSITGDLTLEGYFKANSLPAVGSSMTMLGKWDESGALRSYKMDLYGVSGYFGNGGDGALTISSNTTDAPIDSACTGTSGTQSLSATNTSFAVNQKILIIQTQGTNAGQWEANTIQGYTAGTITLQTPLKNTYTTGAQVIVGKQYTNVTVNSGVTWTAKAWNGTTGGILIFYANGTINVSGTISANGCGFRGANAVSNDNDGLCAEGYLNGSYNFIQNSANGNGGGGGQDGALHSGPYPFGGSGGGGGGNLTGISAGYAGNANGGVGGNQVGSADLTTMVFGGGGGSGGTKYSPNTSGGGATGAGNIIMFGATVTISGLVTANGNNGGNPTGGDSGGGGGGAGGNVTIKAQTTTLGSSLISALGGSGGSYTGTGSSGGTGGNGRVAVYYLTSYSGNANPGADFIQDNTLVTTTTIQARLGISNDGTNFEYLTQNLNNLTTGTWNRLSIAWKASLSTATFYLNAVSLGTSTGTKTAISNNTSLLYIGANKNATVVANFFDGKFNDFRIWNNVQSASQIYANNQIQVSTASSGLAAYYTFNSVYTDGTANANLLTGVNTPTFDTSDVPFPAPTTRLDIDQSFTTIGAAYTLKNTISEAAADSLSFTPVNDPQKSVDFNVSAKGAGNWTVTVHDQQNKIIATQTITNANVASAGYQEFIFTTPWRIVIGKTYHTHLTSSVASDTAAVVTSVASNFSNADFHTYFGFLVTDTKFHPIYPFLDYIAIGNERYIAKWDGAFYYPNFISFPTGWKVRSMSTWREFLAIGVWRGSNINSYTWGRIYFWDGIAPSFNFFIDVPDGQINALYGRDSDLFIIAGYRGDLLDYQGTFFFDTGNSSSNKIRFLPKRSASGIVEVYPGAMTYWRNLLQVGFPGTITTMATIETGVYSYGQYDPQMPNTVSFDYPISTGNRGTTISIGCVYPIGDKLIVGWKDGSGFGADVIDYNNAPAASGRIELMLTDDNAIWHFKTNYQLRADFKALGAGESVDVAMSLERGAFVTSAKDSAAGDTFLSVPAITLSLGTARAREIQLAVDLYATGSTSPTLLGISAIHDELKEEEQF